LELRETIKNAANDLFAFAKAFSGWSWSSLRMTTERLEEA
jgi:hypothetical protein